ncbi:helix-turn-helix domain-containing protein [Methylobacterium iners]|uniref:helix-turn-helix domain-containing protein n=1 Tax=Methylobacterium iners TaxID=418707 RepID=UPI0024B4E582|nr:helix-turn-helix transcriptional regulator [Methylobacterium iners]
MPRRVKGDRARGRHFIAEWRAYRGLTQEQLAERMATTKASISRVENYISSYTQDFLEACAYALMCEPADLIMRNPQDTSAPWSLWERAKEAEREQIVTIMRVIVGDKTGTDG